MRSPDEDPGLGVATEVVSGVCVLVLTVLGIALTIWIAIATLTNTD